MTTEQEWLPLETAPKDGTPIQLRCAGGEKVDVRWGTWEYRGFSDTWWCSATAGWTLSRRYRPEAWRALSKQGEGS